jgi:hypothetical protein
MPNRRAELAESIVPRARKPVQSTQAACQAFCTSSGRRVKARRPASTFKLESAPQSSRDSSETNQAGYMRRLGENHDSTALPNYLQTTALTVLRAILSIQPTPRKNVGNSALVNNKQKGDQDQPPRLRGDHRSAVCFCHALCMSAGRLLGGHFMLAK